MQSRILIVDAVSTNRISLNAALDAGCYDVIERASLFEGLQSIDADRPDLVLCAFSLPDGSAAQLRQALDRIDPDREIPLIALAAPDDARHRRAALRAGLTDLLTYPIDAAMLHAKLRSLLRARPRDRDYGFSKASIGADGPRDARHGFAEGPTAFARPNRIVALAGPRGQARHWAAGLSERLNQPVSGVDASGRHAIFSADPPPEAVIVALSDEASLSFLADLRSHPATRNAVLIAVQEPGAAARAAQALDMGADDAMTGLFDPTELSLRLRAQLRRKTLSDRLRLTVQDGLRAALIDPMTGLYNRRYALPHLSKTIHRASDSGVGFAVMMADLDHFKRVNDTFGHLAGDAVLEDAARRLAEQLGPHDMIARIGGEEFLIVLRDTDAATAQKVADRMRRAIDERPFDVAPNGASTQVTISIGVAAFKPHFAPPPTDPRQEPTDAQVDAVMRQADLALYESKHAGRNTVTLVRAAA